VVEAILCFSTEKFLQTQLPTDRLLLELAKCENQLKLWLCVSPENAVLFAKDPVGALRAADLGLEEDTLQELNLLLSAIAEKVLAAA